MQHVCRISRAGIWGQPIISQRSAPMVCRRKGLLTQPNNSNVSISRHASDSTLLILEDLEPVGREFRHVVNDYGRTELGYTSPKRQNLNTLYEVLPRSKREAKCCTEHSLVHCSVMEPTCELPLYSFPIGAFGYSDNNSSIT